MPFIDESTLERIAESARQARAEVMGVGESTVRRTADVLEVGGMAGGLSFANAKWGTSSAAGAPAQLAVAGVPVDLLAALAGLGTSWFGFAGRYSRDAEMMGAGALASYLSRLGTSYGQAAAGQQSQTSGRRYELAGGAARGLSAAAHAGAAGGKRYVVSEMKG
jgi:hypothetical protein